MSGDPAAARFAIINLARIGGVALVVLGILIVRQVIDLPQAIGWVLVPVGLLDLFIVPQVLARRWRSPAP